MEIDVKVAVTSFKRLTYYSAVGTEKEHKDHESFAL
jgi:hypothetical protein